MPVAVEGADRLHRRERAREKDAKKDELARPGLNLDLRNGCLMGSMPAVSVLIPEAFRPLKITLQQPLLSTTGLASPPTPPNTPKRTSQLVLGIAIMALRFPIRYS